MKNRKEILALVIFFFLATIVSGCKKTEDNAFKEKIIYQSDKDGNFDLYLVDQDTLISRNLTNGAPSDTRTNNNFSPSSSPDGKKIVFQSNRDGNDELYVMDMESKEQLNITQNVAKDYSPSWSPDGRRIAFISDRDSVLVNEDRDIWSNNIYILDVDNMNVRRLTERNETASYNGLSWSPNSKKLVTNLWDVSPNGGYFPRGIYFITLDDASIALLVSEPYNMICCAKWSPNGSKLLYSVLGDNSENIYLINSDGTNQVAVTNNTSFYNSDPSWSPDASYIVFSSNRNGDYDIYVIKSDGSELTKLTNESSDETSPIWLLEPR